MKHNPETKIKFCLRVSGFYPHFFIPGWGVVPFLGPTFPILNTHPYVVCSLAWCTLVDVTKLLTLDKISWVAPSHACEKLHKSSNIHFVCLYTFFFWKYYYQQQPKFVFLKIFNRFGTQVFHKNFFDANAILFQYWLKNFFFMFYCIFIFFQSFELGLDLIFDSTSGIFVGIKQQLFLYL